MSGDKQFQKGAVVLAYVAMVALNGLSATGGGQSIGDISNENPTYVTPDGPTFAIWAIIYTLLLLLVCAQCSADEDVECLLSQRCPLTGLEVRWRIVLAFVLNGVWLPVYTTLRFALALVIIVAYLVALLSVYTALNPKTVSNFCQWLTLAAPIAANASWLTVATCANIFTVAGAYGWKDEFGVAGTPQAAVVVVVFVMTLACFLAFVQFDAAWSAVAAWALAGLSRVHTVPNAERFPVAAMSPAIARAATVGSSVCAVAAVIAAGLALWKWQQQREAPHALLPQ